MKDYVKLALVCGLYSLYLYESYKFGECVGEYIADIIRKKISG